jgi:hypothetical protein
MGPDYDWPNPRGPVPAISLRTQASSYTLSLIGKDQFYGAPGQAPENRDWPVPRGPAYAISLRSHLDPVKVLLAGQDRMFGDPGQVRTFDQPLAPRGPVQANSLLTWGWSALQLLAPAAPFRPLSWPNPRGPVPSDVSIARAVNIPLSITPIIVPPIAQRHWPNPVLRVHQIFMPFSSSIILASRPTSSDTFLSTTIVSAKMASGTTLSTASSSVTGVTAASSKTKVI